MLKNCPDKEGVWLYIPDNREIEIYKLEPVCNQLCFWGPDIGLGYTGATETQGIWDSDEWHGHIMVYFYDNVGPWEFIREL